MSRGRWFQSFDVDGINDLEKVVVWHEIWPTLWEWSRREDTYDGGVIRKS